MNKNSLVSRQGYKIAKGFTYSLLAGAMLVGCGGGGGGGGATPPGTVTMSGTATAPGGTLAFFQPSGLERFFASIVGSPAQAAIEGMAGVAGATVELVEVDQDGNDVEVIATATTNGTGAYSLDTPNGFTPGTQYIVRIEGSTDILESRVFSTSADIDPITTVASGAVETVTTIGGLSAVSTTEVEQIYNAIDDLASEIDPTGLDTTTLTTNLGVEAQAAEEVVNIASSTIATGEICGTVTNSSSAPLANILIIARDFGNWVTRAKTKTASDGTYCLNLPIQGDTDTFTGNTLSGEYILGAFNRTGDAYDSAKHASEWWSISGIAYDQLDAEKITLTSGTPSLTGKNFQLELGARITGTVAGHDTAGAGLEGIKVVIRNYESQTPVAATKTDANGVYRINVIPGSYLVIADNHTIKPYASEIYDGSTGTNNRNMAVPVVANVGDTKTMDFELEAGSRLSGTITDGVTTNPVTGTTVYINDATSGGAAERVRTNKQGNYRIWLKPQSYDVYAYGQRNLALDLSGGNQVASFSGSVSTISGTITAATGGAAVSQAKIRLYDSTGATFWGYAVTNSDGTYTAYTDQTGDHLLEVRIDQPRLAGGQMYDGRTRLASGDAITLGAVPDAATADMALPDGGVLKVFVYAGTSTGGAGGTPDRSTPSSNQRIQLRDDDNLATAGTGTAGADKFITMRSRGDGSAVVSLPAGTYDRLHMLDVPSNNGACGSVAIVHNAGNLTTSTTIVEFFEGDGVCIKS